MKHIFIILGGICLLSCAQQKENKSTPPNILLFLADDWSWPHAGAFGDSVISTPTFDMLANEGILFTNAYCAAPSCSPSRAAILTGMYPHQLEEGANLWGFLPAKYPNYTTILEENDYLVGFERKGWGPGHYEKGGYDHNPAGKKYDDFQSFCDSLNEGQPFCYWFGTYDPHRPYDEVEQLRNGKTANDIKVPDFLPDVEEVKQDLVNYYAEVERFDREIGETLEFLEKKGLLDNTIIVVTSDNGMPFPRAKATVYDAGSRMPLVISWKQGIKKNEKISSFVNLIDLAPTFLKAAGVEVPSEMAGQDLLEILRGNESNHRDHVFLERERHAYVRGGNASYPVRAVRTEDFLYIRNLEPELWPAGDPELVYAVGPFGDVDGSPSKDYILTYAQNENVRSFYNWAFAKRPEEELFDLRNDPHQLYNIATDSKFSQQKFLLDSMLQEWRTKTNDPRIKGNWNELVDYPYFGRQAKTKRQ